MINFTQCVCFFFWLLLVSIVYILLEFSGSFQVFEGYTGQKMRNSEPHQASSFFFGGLLLDQTCVLET